jgi:hypothetical protein
MNAGQIAAELERLQREVAALKADIERLREVIQGLPAEPPGVDWDARAWAALVKRKAPR